MSCPSIFYCLSISCLLVGYMLQDIKLNINSSCSLVIGDVKALIELLP